MTKRTKVAELPEFDFAAHLDDEKTIAAYLTGILEANDPALLASALGVRLAAQPVGVQRNLRIDHY